MREAVLLLALSFVGCGPAVIPQPPAGTQAEKESRSRDKFEAFVQGKTEDEVMSALGRPSSTSKIMGSTFWRYEKITYDPVSQKMDYSTSVEFENGKATKVSFVPGR